jgi:hypothetical protein
MDLVIYIAGALVFFALVMASIALHEIGTSRSRQAVRRQDDRVLRRLRSQAVVSPSR